MFGLKYISSILIQTSYQEPQINCFAIYLEIIREIWKLVINSSNLPTSIQSLFQCLLIFLIVKSI